MATRSRDRIGQHEPPRYSARLVFPIRSRLRDRAVSRPGRRTAEQL